MFATGREVAECNQFCAGDSVMLPANTVVSCHQVHNNPAIAVRENFGALEK
jgi:hypothetical protein